MYFWLIDPLCCKGLRRWLGAVRHSTITKSECEITANSSVGLEASLSLAPSNNVTQMPFFFVSVWALNDHYTTESFWEKKEREEVRPVSLCLFWKMWDLFWIGKKKSRLLLHGFRTAAENKCFCELLCSRTLPIHAVWFPILLVFLQSYHHTIMAFCHRLSIGADR